MGGGGVLSELRLERRVRSCLESWWTHREIFALSWRFFSPVRFSVARKRWLEGNLGVCRVLSAKNVHGGGTEFEWPRGGGWMRHLSLRGKHGARAYQGGVQVTGAWGRFGGGSHWEVRSVQIGRSGLF